MANDGALAAVGDLVSSPRVGGDALLTPRRQQRRGLASWLWRGIFGADEDFQKKLELLSKEEALVHARLKSRARWSQKTARKIIFLSVVLEVVAVSYAIATKRSEEMDWRKRTKCVLPMFVLPCLLAAIYSGLLSFTRMCDIKDQKTLERLRAERQAKIDELKEKTNYYTTQQLIQRYDLDPAAKAAAASVLASKLGADSGLKVHLGDDHVSSQSGTGNDAEMVRTSGLRNRKSLSAGHSTGNSTSELIDETLNEFVASGQDLGSPNQKVIDHFKGSVFSDGGWLARIAAMLVGEDPTQCYALICSHCHMHNGLAKKEDFTFITYYCPHCHSLNGSRRSEDREMSLGSGKEMPTSSADDDNIYRGDNTANAAASGLAAVEEVSGGFETELEKHVIGSSPLLREVRRGTNQKELGGYTR